MRVLIPLGVNNPASLAAFLLDNPYDTKSGYTKDTLFSSRSLVLITVTCLGQSETGIY
jgi:hypothetical protein